MFDRHALRSTTILGLAVAVFAACGGGGGGGGGGATLNPDGDVFSLPGGGGPIEDFDAASNEDGRTVALWSERESDNRGRIRVQILNSDGEAEGRVLDIGNTVGPDPARVAACVHRNGAFATSWERATHWKDSGDGYFRDLGNVRARYYSREGDARGGDFRVNPIELGLQNTPALACLRDGSVAHAWSDQCVCVKRFEGRTITEAPEGCDVDRGDGVFVNRFSAEFEEAVADEQRAGLLPKTTVRGATVAGLGRDHYVTAGLDGSNRRTLTVRRYDRNGEIEAISDVGDAGATDPRVACTADDRCVVVWTNEAGVEAAVFDAAGPLSLVRRVGVARSASPFAAGEPRIVCDLDGLCVVAWVVEGAGGGRFARAFDTDSAALGAAVVIDDNGRRAAGPVVPVVMRSGRFLMLWRDPSDDRALSAQFYTAG